MTDESTHTQRMMSTSIFMRSVGSLALTWGVMACAPDASVERDTAAVDSMSAADPGASADTAALATPSGTDSVPSSAVDQASAAAEPVAAPAIGRDSVIMADFNDPSKRLPPATPDSGSR